MDNNTATLIGIGIIAAAIVIVKVAKIIVQYKEERDDEDEEDDAGTEGTLAVEIQTIEDMDLPDVDRADLVRQLIATRGARPGDFVSTTYAPSQAQQSDDDNK